MTEVCKLLLARGKIRTWGWCKWIRTLTAECKLLLVIGEIRTRSCGKWIRTLTVECKLLLVIGEIRTRTWCKWIRPTVGEVSNLLIEIWEDQTRRWCKWIRTTTVYMIASMKTLILILILERLIICSLMLHPCTIRLWESRCSLRQIMTLGRVCTATSIQK